MLEDFLIKKDNKRFNHIEHPAVDFGLLLHHIEGKSQAINGSYQRYSIKKKWEWLDIVTLTRITVQPKIMDQID